MYKNINMFRERGECHDRGVLLLLTEYKRERGREEEGKTCLCVVSEDRVKEGQSQVITKMYLKDNPSETDGSRSTSPNHPPSDQSYYGETKDGRESVMYVMT